MRNTVIKLALDDVFRNRKRSCVQIMLIALSAMLFFLVVISLPHYMNLYRQYCHKYYGDWYAYADIPDEGIDLYCSSISREDRYGGWKDFGMKTEGVTEPSEEDILRFGYLYKQGRSDDFVIGHADDSLYDLCRLDLVSGSYPQDHEVMITQEVSKEYKCGIGDRLLLEVNGEKEYYTVSGIMHKSQDLFPDIYTDMEEGDAYVFFDRHFGQYADTGRYVISHFGFYLDYIENEYGYDHYTRNNDTWMWDNSHDSFTDYTMAMMISAGIVILILYFMNTSFMKKRIRELSLLRSIGMTGAQIVCMVLVYVSFISLCAVITGLILAVSAGSAADLYIQHMYQINDGITYRLYLQEPMKTAGTGIMIILFALLGSFVPVLRAAQNTLSGSFEGASAHGRGHKTSLRFLDMKRLALRELSRTKGICAGALVFAVLIGVLILPGGSQTMETYRSSEGAGTAKFASAHYIYFYGLEEPLDEKLISGLPLKRETYFMHTTSEYAETVSGTDEGVIGGSGFIIAADEHFSQNAVIEGRYPEKDDEALLMTESAELMIIEEYLNGTLMYYTGKRVHNGDRIRCEGREYTVTGMVMPDETVKYPIGFASDPDYALDLNLYSIPSFLIAVTPHEYERFTSKEVCYESLAYDDPGDAPAILNELFKRGADLDNAYLSDTLVLSSEYSQQGFNMHIPRKMLAVPVLFGLLIFSLLQYSFMHASRDELIIYRSLGMTAEQAVIKEACKALFMCLASSVLFILYCIYIYAVSGAWRLDAGTMILFILFSLVFFTVMYMVPVRASLKADYENLREE